MSANIIGVKNIKGISAQFVRNYILSSIGISFLERAQSGQVQGKITTQDIVTMPIPLVKNEQMLNCLIENSYKLYKQKFAKADELLSGMDEYVINILHIKMPDYQDKLCTAVSLSTIKTDSTMSADYYHVERLETIKMMKHNEFISTAKLCEKAEFQRSIVSALENNQKYLGLASVQSNTGELSGVEEIAEGQAFEYKSGDLLYARLRPYLNKVYVAEEDGICSTEFHVIRTNTSNILLNYLGVIMRSKLILSQTKHMMTGNTHPRISNDDVKNLLIPIPSKEIQKQIADEAIRRREEARRLKEEAESEWKQAKEQFEKELLGE